jgi:hypothetical protein
VHLDATTIAAANAGAQRMLPLLFHHDGNVGLDFAGNGLCG